MAVSKSRRAPRGRKQRPTPSSIATKAAALPAVPALPDPAPASRAEPFEHAASRVLGRLQVALADLLQAMPVQPHTASEVERALGVDYKLSWQIHRIATAKNPLAGGSSVPARVSMKKLLNAASRRRVSAAVIAKVSEAFEAFERLIEAEASDRAELESMLAAFVPEARDKRELDIKTAAFKAATQLKSVAMDAQVGAFLLHPSADGSMVDRATFSAYLCLRKLNSAAHIGFATHSATVPGSAVLTLDREPTDGLHSILLPQYCSRPTPRFSVSKHGINTWYSVEGESVGLSAAVRLVMAELRPGAMKRYRQPEGRTMSGVMNLTDIPMKRQTTDIYLHRDVYPGSLPRLGVYDTVPRGLAPGIDDPAREPDRVLFEESVIPIAGGLGECGLTHMARYGEMLAHVCEKLGWNPADFRGYRLDVLYPVYGAQYMIGFDLPELPK